MADLTTIRLSKDANAVAEKLVATGKFENVITAAKFALAYALRHYFDDFDPQKYEVSDGEGSNYNFGTLDKDGQLSQLIRALYPGIETPYIYARALMVYGLLKIGEVIEKEGDVPYISSLCD